VSELKRNVSDIKIEVVGKLDISGLSDGERAVFFDSLLNRLKEITNNQNGGNQDNGHQTSKNLL